MRLFAVDHVAFVVVVAFVAFVVVVCRSYHSCVRLRLVGRTFVLHLNLVGCWVIFVAWKGLSFYVKQVHLLASHYFPDNQNQRTGIPPDPIDRSVAKRLNLMLHLNR